MIQWQHQRVISFGNYGLLMAGIKLMNTGQVYSIDAIMNVIRTEEDGESLTISVIVGIGTGLYTRPEFGCRFFETTE